MNSDHPAPKMEAANMTYKLYEREHDTHQWVIADQDGPLTYHADWNEAYHAFEKRFLGSDIRRKVLRIEVTV